MVINYNYRGDVWANIAQPLTNEIVKAKDVNILVKVHLNSFDWLHVESIKQWCNRYVKKYYTNWCIKNNIIVSFKFLENE